MTQNLPPILTSTQAKAILEGKTSISLDLGLTKTRIYATKDDYYLGNGEYIDNESLKKIAQTEGAAFFVDNKSVFMAATSGKHYYRLIPTTGAPTLEIDGIRMHRTKDTTPDQDTTAKLKLLNIRGGVVLDTCMGLGYTAIHAVMNGASHVVTIEIEPNVLRISKINPWSSELYNSESIHKLIGDSFHIIEAFNENQFDYIIHDPPRHSASGQLYGQEFYHKLAHVINEGGKMFHYTGEPGSKYRKVNIHPGIKRRLSQAGFSDITYHPKVMGFTCVRTV